MMLIFESKKVIGYLDSLYKPLSNAQSLSEIVNSVGYAEVFCK